MSAQLFDGSMAKQSHPRYSPEFRLDAAQLVLDQGYTVKKAADAMGVGKSTMGKWVQQLRRERHGQPFKGSPMTPDQKRIRELEKRVRDLEMEKDILKKLRHS
ncbi:IS911, transposase orfA [Oceanococcus atlanticus]|uniref:IS911, transposase orfA n=1 Tax=Oceanococcus atlanticus TaxID=1317117 RepID=A0A1Y1SCZ9_9GAMM|nr:transposase [Oceanococcus atlanticus]ORE86849.1 IS911, transposase orfA [Oceanococcus atlanticus]